MKDDLNDDIRAAFEAAETEATAVEPVAAIPEPVTETPEPEAEQPVSGEDGRVRGPDGKFVAKDAEKAQDTPKVEAETEPQEAIRPPATWTPAAKAKFATLDPVIQQEVLKREKESYRALEDRARQIKRYEPLESVIEPYRQKWQVAGVDEATAVKQLLAASDWLERDPAQAIAYLARQYGVSAGQPGPAQSPQGPVHTGQPNEIQQLQSEIARLSQMVEKANQAPLLSEVERFSSDPANLYFDNVRDDMALLLDAGKASDLKEAYEMACYMRPDIRPLLMQPVNQSAPKQDKVTQERRAAASVTGAPGNPAIPKSNGSIEDDIRLAFLEAGGQA